MNEYDAPKCVESVVSHYIDKEIRCNTKYPHTNYQKFQNTKMFAVKTGVYDKCLN